MLTSYIIIIIIISSHSIVLILHQVLSDGSLLTAPSCDWGIGLWAYWSEHVCHPLATPGIHLAVPCVIHRGTGAS